MKRRLAFCALVVIAAVAAAWIALTGAESMCTRLTPAWSLISNDRFRGTWVTDPFVSWSPDSRALLFSGYSKVAQKDEIFLWNVGERKLSLVTFGTSPNYLDADSFLYLVREPRAIYKRSLRTGKQTEILQSLKSNEFWPDVTGFTYDPSRKVLTLRLVEFTQRYLAGTEAYTLDGKPARQADTYQGEGIVDSSCDPAGRRCAVVIEGEGEAPDTLELAREGRSRGREVARGRIGAVAWSPRGDIVAYADLTRVIALRPGDGRRVVVGVLGVRETKRFKRTVVRLSWSPDGAHLAALVYVSSMTGDFPMIYVLDMSAFSWD